MGDPLPTVEVEHPSNPDRKVILNEDDYDPDEYTLWGEGGDEGSEEPQGDGEAHICGAELSSGNECSREVDAEGDRCWQHEA